MEIRKILALSFLTTLMFFSLNTKRVYPQNNNPKINIEYIKKKKNLREIFNEELNSELKLQFWENNVIQKIPYQLSDSIVENTPLTPLTQKWVDNVQNATEKAYLKAISKTIGKTHLYNEIEEVVKGLTSIKLEKIKGRKTKLKSLSINRKINPLDRDINELENNIERLKSIGLFYQANKKEKKLKGLKSGKNLEFEIEAGINITKPPKKLQDLLKINEYGLKLYTKAEYSHIKPELFIYLFDNKIGLETDKKFLDDKITLSGKHNYIINKRNNISEINLNYRINPGLEFEFNTEYYWKRKTAGFYFNLLKEFKQGKELSLETSYHYNTEEKPSFLFLLKFKSIIF